MSDNHPLRTRILGTVIGGLILALFLWLAGFFPTIWYGCKSASIWVFHFLLSSVSMPIWSLIVIFLMIVPTLIRILSWFRQKEVNYPSWHDYDQDVILEIRWRWHYSPYGGEIANISYFCPSDDTQLIYEDWGSKTVFRCETCGRRFGPMEGSRNYIIGMVQRQIDRKIRTGEWKDIVQRLN
ncbi:MAG: hypothetical protein ACLPT6_13505 [Desulfobaccales bacterium]